MSVSLYTLFLPAISILIRLVSAKSPCKEKKYALFHFDKPISMAPIKYDFTLKLTSPKSSLEHTV